MSSPRVDILFVGTGAIGAFYASRLHQPENNVYVSVTARSNYKDIAEKGIILETRDFGNYTVKPHAVYSSVDQVRDQVKQGKASFDFVVVTTKALPDRQDESLLLDGLLSPKSSIVLIQNGLGIEQVFRDRFSSNSIISSVTVANVNQISSGVFKQNRWTRISNGPYIHGDGSGTQEEMKVANQQAQKFTDLLIQGGIKDAEVYDEAGLQFVRWHKLAINASMNPSSVLSYGTGNARMAKDPDLRHHLKGCMNEILETAPKILKKPWPPKLGKIDAEKLLSSTERASDVLPSMMLDWKAHRPLEIEVILGNPIRIAQKHGYEMPRLQSMYSLLRMAQIRRTEDEKAQSKL